MWVKIFIILLLVEYLKADCNVCQSGNAACLSRNRYSICINGKPLESSKQCPTGYICTGEKYVCYLEAEGYNPICLDDSDNLSSSTEEITTLTVSALISTPLIDTDDYLKEICSVKGDGNFQNENDPTCKTFISCSSGEATVVNCERIDKIPTYFNGLQCKYSKPDYCTEV